MTAGAREIYSPPLIFPPIGLMAPGGLTLGFARNFKAISVPLSVRLSVTPRYIGLPIQARASETVRQDQRLAVVTI